MSSIGGHRRHLLKENRKDVLVIGIDFGTTYSGVAWATAADFEKGSINVISSWPGTGREEGKAPTEISYDGGQVLWGYDIPTHASRIQWFKLLLLENEDLSLEMQKTPFIQSARDRLRNTGKTAVDATADYLGLLWRHVLSVLEKALGSSVKALSFHVVLTVPAIWKDYARRKMETAAQQAGILSRRLAGPTRLSLVPEPEAASLSTLLDRHDTVAAGKVFVVCDAGGGTVTNRNLINVGIVIEEFFNTTKHREEDRIWNDTEGVWKAKNQMRWYLKKGTSTPPAKYAMINRLSESTTYNRRVAVMALRTLSSLVLAVSLAAAVDVRDRNMDLERSTNSGPSIDIARQRGPAIFNAVHDAMRQWGSSLHHNGMSFFLATVPEGVLLHHGSSQKASPTHPEWLAYEIEHAENFARPPGWPHRPERGRHGDAPERPKTREDPQQVLRPEANTQPETEAGWLHVYRTIRPLHYLYIDGMGAGKTTMGTLDSQDFVLRGLSPESVGAEHGREGPPGGGPADEMQRAADLCRLVTPWGLQGVIRMEAGFEIIQCDFADGLDQVQALRRPRSVGGPGGGPGHGGPGGMGSLEFLRGLSERYQGIGSHRTRIDYASMVSAYFFPLNLTNPDVQRPDLARLVSASTDGLAAVRTQLAAVVANRSDTAAVRPIDWQDVTDMIVARYADRLQYMATEVTSTALLVRELGFLLDVFIDYEDDEADTDFGRAVDRCTDYYFRAVVPTTATDELIQAALVAVTHEICTMLFGVRERLESKTAVERTELDANVALADAVAELRSLMTHLNWARFKRCPTCALGQVCTIPMWPMGTVGMYNSPRCSNGSDMWNEESYWGSFGRPGGHRDDPEGR
ncbi:hypothetical protein CMQ_7851 [Grosmannia clavigera kw1407]|uniref:Uncharacterized protein n=1 Tax=Grosmannia clavigera (strain kw1407 / UAMH 11150) TaxID=655863 RepID=F0XRW9_GROCL|nr:uncharacterized protein CMQ_7851 [Grosmannia clavigera kw1407]EFW99483.1 hypothetical protein CMQ_7851 [Grosmannia clavigera kw1407]